MYKKSLILLLSIVFLISLVNALQVRQIYSVVDDETGGVPIQAIAIQDSKGQNRFTFQNGESVYYTNSQDVDDNLPSSCLSLS